ncbi:hypothetical protein GCK72_018977 [Caenorhabditis remanei]|uniref:Peptidase S1 domain-containing protein n=1 Tax=Caenorhabditis remanei TaxID=31234 RepID=A0A6A5GD94_CAERE|nr:hypothetical protein GCK72_018977 [Caenorhabditis remanei]KAF1752422.1 hypothetical protein GCK72_018977 [Caenorhabditis remanei]
MKTLLFLFVILFVGIQAGLIDSEENRQLYSSCGRKTGYERKMIHGDLVKKGEHPWAVSIYVRYLNKTINKYVTLLGPGTMISSKHIVAFNTVRRNGTTLTIIGLEDTDYEGTCEGNHLVLPEELYSRYDYDFEHLKKFNGSRQFSKNSIVKITALNGCKEGVTLGNSNPLILEISSPPTVVYEAGEHFPVCISNSPYNWKDVSQFTVYGMNQPGMLVSGKFQPVVCESEVPFSCATAVNKYQGLCQGDFGGSAVAKFDDRYIMLGLYARGNTKCNADSETLPEFMFLNLGYYRQEICETTGVCVAPPPADVSHIPPFNGWNLTTVIYSPVGQTTAEPPLETTLINSVETTTTDEEISTGTTETYTTSVPETPVMTTENSEHTTLTNGNTKYVSIGEDGEVIEAETFAPMRINLANCSDGNIITAERIEPMKIGNNQTRGTRVRNINIHIHLNQ